MLLSPYCCAYCPMGTSSIWFLRPLAVALVILESFFAFWYDKKFQAQVIHFCPKFGNNITTRSPSSFQWEMVFRNHRLCTRNPHCYSVGLYSSAFQLTQPGNIIFSGWTTRKVPLRSMTIEVLLNLINFTSGFFSSHALNLISQRCQNNYSFALSYNRQWPQNNIITTAHERPV